MQDAGGETETTFPLDKTSVWAYNNEVRRPRGVANFGIALASGARGPGFESLHSDQLTTGIALFRFRSKDMAENCMTLSRRSLQIEAKQPLRFVKGKNIWKGKRFRILSRHSNHGKIFETNRFKDFLFDNKNHVSFLYKLCYDVTQCTCKER